jgi:hypothetical protein
LETPVEIGDGPILKRALIKIGDHRLHRTKLKKALHDRQYLRTCLAHDGDSAFVLTSQVRQQPVCMISVLESRQQKLLKRFSDVWELA